MKSLGAFLLGLGILHFGMEGAETYLTRAVVLLAAVAVPFSIERLIAIGRGRR